jgi:hypothetical protein
VPNQVGVAFSVGALIGANVTPFVVPMAFRASAAPTNFLPIFFREFPIALSHAVLGILDNRPSHFIKKKYVRTFS